MGAYTSDNTLREKWSGRQTAEDYQQKNFDGENVDNLIKICQHFPHQNFVPCCISVRTQVVILIIILCFSC